MTTAILSQRSAAHPTRALAIGAIVSHQRGLMLLIRRRRDLRPCWHSIREWAIRHDGWVVFGAYLLSNMSYPALVILLNDQIRGTWGAIDLGLLTIGSALGASLFTSVRMPPHSLLSITTKLQVIFGSAQLVRMTRQATHSSRQVALKFKGGNRHA